MKLCSTWRIRLAQLAAGRLDKGRLSVPGRQGIPASVYERSDWPGSSDDLRLARADGTYGRHPGKLARMDRPSSSMIGGSLPWQDQERRDLLEILEDRYGARSTIVTSQLPPGQWHEYPSASRPWPTPSAIGCSTTPTESC